MNICQKTLKLHEMEFLGMTQGEEIYGCKNCGEVEMVYIENHGC